ncbi:hypothetical protein ACRRTK_017944 [Alexandromys fortis]
MASVSHRHLHPSLEKTREEHRAIAVMVEPDPYLSYCWKRMWSYSWEHEIDYHTHPKGSLPQGDHGPEAMTAYPISGDSTNTGTAMHIGVKSRVHPLERSVMVFMFPSTRDGHERGGHTVPSMLPEQTYFISKADKAGL